MPRPVSPVPGQMLGSKSRRAEYVVTLKGTDMRCRLKEHLLPGLCSAHHHCVTAGVWAGGCAAGSHLLTLSIQFTTWCVFYPSPFQVSQQLPLPSPPARFDHARFICQQTNVHVQMPDNSKLLILKMGTLFSHLHDTSKGVAEKTE